MTDLGEIDSYLGVSITRDWSLRLLEINQSHYIQEIINCFRMSDGNPTHTPLPSGMDTHLVKYKEQATTSEIKAYQQVIGSLIYI